MSLGPLIAVCLGTGAAIGAVIGAVLLLVLHVPRKNRPNNDIHA